MAAFARSEPFRSDDDENGIGLCQRLLNMNSKILSEWNAVDVDEDGIVAVAAGNPVANAPGEQIRVRTTI
jgi:hypothetical protein